MRQIVQNQVGAKIRVRLVDQDGEPVPLTGHTTLEILAKPERGALKQWEAEPFGEEAAGVLEHETEAGDLAEFGRWQLQAHLVTPALDVRGLLLQMEVEVALDA